MRDVTHVASTPTTPATPASPAAGWRAATALLLAAVLGMAGCASTLRLENDVRSFPTWPADARPTQGDTYAFERLPSQRQPGTTGSQDLLEQLAVAALTQVGLQLTPDAAQARWRVQVLARGVQMPRSRWDARFSFGLGYGTGYGTGFGSTLAHPYPFGIWPSYGGALGGAFGSAFGPDFVVDSQGRLIPTPLFRMPDPPYYQREVSVVLRDARSGQVVYESTATHDGPWRHSNSQWAALLEAALDGFPEPPIGARRVVIEVPR